MTVDPRASPAAEPPPSGLPAHLAKPPPARHLWDLPTAWLLGTKLLASLADIAISSLFKFDPRDWMSPGQPIDLSNLRIVRPDVPEESEGCWIDYFSDTGDSPRLVYQLAYLLQQPELEVHVRGARGDVPFQFDGTATTRRLPRGQALFVGGDTAYPVATRRRLLERVRAPFIWARQAQNIPIGAPDEQIPIFGIPGNHDYYNALDGFERQFHQRPAEHPAVPLFEDVTIPGYVRRQQASYFAITLPHGWDLWAFDLEKREIDSIQLDYFKAAASKRAQGPVSRILLTSRPMYVYHNVGEHAEEQQRSLDLLGIEPLYRERSGQPRDPSELRLDLSGDVHVYERYWGQDAPTQVATEHGAADTRRAASDGPSRRYVAVEVRAQSSVPPASPAGAPATGNEVVADACTPESPRYASVVSGLGGAFHHPGQCRARANGKSRLAPRAAWPSARESAREVGERLIRPRKVFQAGAVGVVGAVVAFLNYALARSPHHDSSVLDAPFMQSWPVAQLQNLALVAATIACLAVLGAALYGLAMFGRRLSQPIKTMTPADQVRGIPLRAWARVTYSLSHNRVVFWCLRWAGANRRNLWGTLISLPAWGLAVALAGGVVIALASCPHFEKLQDGYLPLYLLTSLIVLGMTALGTVMAGKYTGRLRGCIFGLVTGLVVIWTPYAWTRATLTYPWMLVGLVLYFMPRYLLTHVFDFLVYPTRWRRFWALVAWLILLAMFVVPPIWVLRQHPFEHCPTSGGGYVAALVFGGYLSSLWIGWYFYLCLQWNGHANEAGGAARVVSFAEFVRIKLTRDRAEIFVIAVEGPESRKRGIKLWTREFWARRNLGETPPIARLVDHFFLERGATARGTGEGSQ